MARYWPSSFFPCLWTKLKSIKTQKKKGQYPAILTKQAWPIKDLPYGIKQQNTINFLVGQSLYPERERYFHLARLGNQSQRKIWFILPAHRASPIIITCNAVRIDGSC